MYYISVNCTNYNPDENTFDIEVPEFDLKFKGLLTGFYWLNPTDYNIICESGYNFDKLLTTHGLPVVKDEDLSPELLEAVMNNGILIRKLTSFFDKIHEGLDMVRQEMFEFTDNDIRIEVS